MDRAKHIQYAKLAFLLAVTAAGAALLAANPLVKQMDMKHEDALWLSSRVFLSCVKYFAYPLMLACGMAAFLLALHLFGGLRRVGSGRARLAAGAVLVLLAAWYACLAVMMTWQLPVWVETFPLTSLWNVALPMSNNLMRWEGALPCLAAGVLLYAAIA